LEEITVALSLEALLNIPGVRVMNSEVNEREISIQLEFASNYSICHKCGQPATEFHAQGETLRLRHLPIFNRPVYLYLHTKRYRCLACDDHPTTTQRGDWYDTGAHCTKAFADFLLLELVNSTTSDVERKHAVSYDVVRGLLERYVQASVDWEQLKQLRVLGLDEISLRKGHRDFVTIVSTRDAQDGPCLLAVLEGREKAPVVAFLKSIPAHLRATVEYVCTDLYEGFVNAVKEVLPQAQVVADRFHVAKLYRAAVDELRKQEMKELKQLLEPDEYALFKGVMWLLRRPSDELTSEELQLLELLFECAPLLGKAYGLRKKLDAIFETSQTKQAAVAALRAWIKAVKASGLACFDKFIGTLENWMDEITNYFISRLSSGWIEGFNNKIKVLKRRCYGITNIASLFRRIWLDLRGFEAFAH
jgi:transposase